MVLTVYLVVTVTMNRRQIAVCSLPLARLGRSAFGA